MNEQKARSPFQVGFGGLTADGVYHPEYKRVSQENWWSGSECIYQPGKEGKVMMNYVRELVNSLEKQDEWMLTQICLLQNGPLLREGLKFKSTEN